MDFYEDMDAELEGYDSEPLFGDKTKLPLQTSCSESDDSDSEPEHEAVREKHLRIVKDAFREKRGQLSVLQQSQKSKLA